MTRTAFRINAGLLIDKVDIILIAVTLVKISPHMMRIGHVLPFPRHSCDQATARTVTAGRN